MFVLLRYRSGTAKLLLSHDADITGRVSTTCIGYRAYNAEVLLTSLQQQFVYTYFRTFIL